MRIIAGRLGGRRIVAPEGLETRPTIDRVREALFSMLGPIGGARVLDLYAGTGALGLEAISRGASHGVFVETFAPAVAAIRANIATLGLGAETQVVVQSVERALPRLAGLGPFDLVFVDPPYALAAQAGHAVAAFAAGGAALTAGARVILEHSSKTPPPALEGLVAKPSRRYGDTTITIYARAPIAAE